jgi:hypothetical protein
MSAEGFLVYYGLRWEFNVNDEEQLRALETRKDQRVQAARKHGLDSWWGRTEEEERYFLLIGKALGNFGWEGEHYVCFDDSQVQRILDDTKKMLQAAGCPVRQSFTASLNLTTDIRNQTIAFTAICRSGETKSGKLRFPLAKLIELPP